MYLFMALLDGVTAINFKWIGANYACFDCEYKVYLIFIK